MIGVREIETRVSVLGEIKRVLTQENPDLAERVRTLEEQFSTWSQDVERRLVWKTEWDQSTPDPRDLAARLLRLENRSVYGGLQQ